MNTFFALLHGNSYHYFECLHDMAVCWCSNIKNYFYNIGYLIIWPQVFILIGDNNWWGGAGCYTFCSLSYILSSASPPLWALVVHIHALVPTEFIFLNLHPRMPDWRVWRSPRHRKSCRKGFLGSSHPKPSFSLWPFTFGYPDFS